MNPVVAVARVGAAVIAIDVAVTEQPSVSG